MSIIKVTARPSIYTVTAQGRVFQHLNGGEVSLRFRGIDDAWSEEVKLVSGDSLRFDRDFYSIDISAEFETSVEVYAGHADMRRASTDLTPLGSSSIRTGSLTAEKAQKLLVSERRNRRSLTILPLDAMVYIGSLGTNVNDQIPVMAGQPITLDVKGAVYVELNPAHTSDTADVRYLEEIN